MRPHARAGRPTQHRITRIDRQAWRKIPVVLFDLDGTPTDPKEVITRSIAYALARMAREVPETNDLLFAIGPPLRTSFAMRL